jgi:hypothetical protein
MNARYSPIDDVHTLAKARELVEQITEDHFDLRLQWLEQHRWAVAPVLGEQFEPETARMLVETIATLGVSRYVGAAVDREITEHVCPAYWLDLSPESLLDVAEEEYVGLSYLLSTLDGRFGVLVADEYRLYAGPRGFVEQAIGRTIEKSCEELLAEWADCPSACRLQKAFEEMVKRYEPFR